MDAVRSRWMWFVGILVLFLSVGLSTVPGERAGASSAQKWPSPIGILA